MANKSFTLDEFIVQLGLNDKITAKLAALENRTLKSANKIEAALNRAFRVNPKFGQVVSSANVAAGAIKTAFSQSMNFEANGIKSVQSVERAGIKSARLLQNAYSNIKIPLRNPGNNPPAHAPRGGGNTARPSNRIDSMATTQYFSGLTRRLERMGSNGTAQARKLRLGVFEASQQAKLSGDVERFRIQIRKLTDSASKWADSNRKGFQHGESLNSGLGRLAVSAGALATAWVGAKKVIDSGVKRDSAVSAANAVLGTDDSNKAQTFSYEHADKLGMKYTDVLSNLTKFEAGAKPAMGYQGAQDFFQNVSTFGRLRGLDSEQMKGIMVAFTQMASKGRVSAEELRGQLGDRLPGSEQTVADALGLDLPSLDKLMQNGKLLAKDVLPKVSKHVAELNEKAGGIEAASKMAVSSMGRVQNGLDNNLAAGFKGGEAGIRDFSASLATLLGDTQETSKAVGAGFGSMLKVASKWVDYADYVARQTEATVLRVEAWYMDLDDGQKKLVDGATKFGAEVATTVTVITALTGAVKALKLAAAIGGLTSKAAGTGAGAAGAAAAGGIASKAAGKLGSGIKTGGQVGLLLSLADFVDETGLEKKYPRLLGKDNPIAKGLNYVTGAGNPEESKGVGFENSNFMKMVHWFQGNNALKDGAVDKPAVPFGGTEIPSFFENVQQQIPEQSTSSGFDVRSLFRESVPPAIKVEAPKISTQQDITVQVNLDGVMQRFRGDAISNEFENVNINTEHLED